MLALVSSAVDPAPPPAALPSPLAPLPLTTSSVKSASPRVRLHLGQVLEAAKCVNVQSSQKMQSHRVREQVVDSGFVQRLHVNTCGGRAAAAVRALPWPRPVVGREATVEVSEGLPPAVVATDMAVPPRTEATGRLPPPVDGMRALDAMARCLPDSKINIDDPRKSSENSNRFLYCFATKSPPRRSVRQAKPSLPPVRCADRRSIQRRVGYRGGRREGRQARLGTARRFVSRTPAFGLGEV